MGFRDYSEVGAQYIAPTASQVIYNQPQSM